MFLSTIVVALISQNTLLRSSAAAGPQQKTLNGAGEELTVNQENPLDMTQTEREPCAFRLVCGHLWLPNELRSSEPHSERQPWRETLYLPVNLILSLSLALLFSSSLLEFDIQTVFAFAWPWSLA